MDLIPEIRKRQSIRHFKSEPFEEEKLMRILEAGRLAPSAKNRQEWRFVVVQQEELRQKIKEAAFGQDHVGQAPVIIAACTTNIDYRMPNGQFSYPIDTTFSISYMSLQAVKEGLGSCVVTTFDEQEVKDLLSVPYAMRVVMLLLLGKVEEYPEPQHKKTFQRVFSFNHW